MSVRIIPHTGGTRVQIVQPARASESERAALAEAVRSGLLATPKTLPWPFFYDERGSRLFDQICELPEYYLTRTEDALLEQHAEALVDGWEVAPTLVELGSGSATKTRRLIGAALRRYGTLHYVPIDVSPTFIEESAATLMGAFPALRVTGHVGDYRSELARVAERIAGPKLLIFLGSSLGNYEPREAAALLRQLSWALGPADRFLLGADLDKDPAVLEAAYDDRQGITAQFNLNLLTRINRELGADFDLARFRHEARYHAELRRVEMHLVSLATQTVNVPGARLAVKLAAGESIHTENSYKYTSEGLRALAAEAGLAEEAAWTDARGFFRLQRWRLGAGAGREPVIMRVEVLMTTLTPELRREIEKAGEQPVRFADPETHVEYVILKADVFEKMRVLMEAEHVDPSFYEYGDFIPLHNIDRPAMAGPT